MISSDFPIRFNPWKHHLNWVHERIQFFISNPNDFQLKNSITENVNTINSNQVDIYTGKYTPEEIIQNIHNQLEKWKITDNHIFTHWLGSQGYQELILNDTSKWILRQGLEKSLYVHIHPARNSPNAVRIHGNSWKVAIITKAFYPNLGEMDLLTINNIRKQHLDLSPIKDLNACQRLMKVMRLLDSI